MDHSENHWRTLTTKYFEQLLQISQPNTDGFAVPAPRFETQTKNIIEANDEELNSSICKFTYTISIISKWCKAYRLSRATRKLYERQARAGVRHNCDTNLRWSCGGKVGDLSYDLGVTVTGRRTAWDYTKEVCKNIKFDFPHEFTITKKKEASNQWQPLCPEMHWRASCAWSTACHRNILAEATNGAEMWSRYVHLKPPIRVYGCYKKHTGFEF